MRLNIDRDLVKQLVSGQLPNKSRHLDELTHEPAIWSWDTGQWLSCFDSCQLTILWMSYIKDVDLPRHARDTLPFDSLPYPTRTICRRIRMYVRTYVRSITWQPNEKRLTIFYEYGARRARGSPANALLLYKSTSLNAHQIGLIISIKHILNWFKILYPSPLQKGCRQHRQGK